MAWIGWDSGVFPGLREKQKGEQRNPGEEYLDWIGRLPGERNRYENDRSETTT